MNKAMFALVATECREAIKNEATLEGRLRAAMKVAKHHWMMPDEDTKLKGAVASVYEVSDEETKARIEVELKSLQYLSAMLAGVQVDLNSIPKLENPIGILKLWQETP